jgi:nucleotide-binding universal stress UspA family protein
MSESTRTVLVPVDDSERSTAAIRHAVERYPDADVVALHVVDVVSTIHAADPEVTAPGYWEQLYEAAEAGADAVLADAEAAAADLGAEIRTERVDGRPARRIVEYAAEHDVDEVVIASHGRTGVSRILLGSIAEEVVRRAPCPVTVVR